MKYKLRLLASILATATACGGPAKPTTTTPIKDPVPMEPAPVPVADEPVEPAQPVQPPAPDPAKIKAELLAAETAAYDKAKPVFDKYCSSCHTKGAKGAKPKTLEHFDMTTYPFGGHHAMELGKEIREVLAIGGGKATMPKNQPGAVKGDELAAIAAWADAFDASHTGGAHEGHGPAHDTGHKH